MSRMRHGVLLFSTLFLAAAIAWTADRTQTPKLRHSPSFLAHWSDGAAELNAYDLTFPRYGAPRRGTAVAIFVKEPFLNSTRVKPDEGSSRHDVFEVMKLNLVHDFSTGIYDYNMMTSTFAALEPSPTQRSGEIAKVSFSAQEWCGQTWAQVVFRRGRIEETIHSYFEKEADSVRSLSSSGDALSEDAVLLWARGIALPEVKPGSSQQRTIFSSTLRARILHKPAALREAKFSRAPGIEETTVPAGRFRTRRATLEVNGGLRWDVDVEEAFPNRIIRWSTSDNERGELLGSTRLAYWKMNGPGFERELAKLGLKPRAGRMP